MSKVFITALSVLIGMLILITSTAPAFAPENVKKIKIAIIDTGIDTQHEYLKNNMWVNPGETGIDRYGNQKSSNNIDDDKNGLVDDVSGWSFSDNSKNVVDTEGHGTHIAGVIKSNITQIDPEVAYEFMVLKFYKKGMTYKEQQNAFLKSLHYAIDKKADIINISAGGRTKNSEELNLFKIAQSLGIQIVAAAGNKRLGEKDYRFYPAAYELPNVLSVVATNNDGEILVTSNRNHNKPNLAAKGSKIYSSLPQNRFGYKTGSSQAAAVVTARVACQEYHMFSSRKQGSHRQKVASVTNSSALLHNL